MHLPLSLSLAPTPAPPRFFSKNPGRLSFSAHELAVLYANRSAALEKLREFGRAREDAQEVRNLFTSPTPLSCLVPFSERMTEQILQPKEER